MDELYMYYTVLYWKFSSLWRWYNTNYIVMTNYTTGLLNQTVSYQSISYSDPAYILQLSLGLYQFEGECSSWISKHNHKPISWLLLLQFKVPCLAQPNQDASLHASIAFSDGQG